jgi:hypothetical protein
MESTMFEHPLIKSSAAGVGRYLCRRWRRTKLCADRQGMQRQVQKAAKSGGTLNGLTWNEFRKQECEGKRPR